jgi:hypothetical protein
MAKCLLTGARLFAAISPLAATAGKAYREMLSRHSTSVVVGVCWGNHNEIKTY